MLRKATVLLGVLSISLIVVGCQTISSAPAPRLALPVNPVSSLDATSWRVKLVAGRGLMDHLSLNIDFKINGEVVGFSGCNRFMGRYEIVDSYLHIESLASSRKLCSKVIMNQEFLLLNELRKPLLLSQTDNRVIKLINNESEVTILMMQ
ncbi:META domain-containing protein [Neptunomonas antarctica]|uniref:META domain-containing protein n=1 Tax=Neptunomonas antarctica TaxID=619304 RepID=A0A1N7JWP9_9GAMM|nr:META domain-containing protein [Neptunomonas antarctica]SIS53750.1 META domain-containing protein [Neptunomonas antarctica]